MTDSGAGPTHLPRLLAELCAEHGATVYADPDFEFAGYMEFRSGRRRLFRGTALDINRQGAAEIARDKGYALDILRRSGFAVPDGVMVFSPAHLADLRLKRTSLADGLTSLEAAHAFADARGYPVYVKPNEGSQGRGVSVAGTAGELGAAIDRLFPEYPRVLVQAPAAGRDYRVVVLDGAVRAAYERRRLSIVGDGLRTIAELAAEVLAALRRGGGEPRVAADDARIAEHLLGQGLASREVAAAGLTITLLPVANLSTGGSAADISDALAPPLAALCVAATEALGLNFAGVDLLCDDAEDGAGGATILEVNASPGLHNFARLGPGQAARVRGIYAAIVARLAAES